MGLPLSLSSILPIAKERESKYDGIEPSLVPNDAGGFKQASEQVDEEILRPTSILPHVICAPLIDIPGAGGSSSSSTSSKESSTFFAKVR